MHPNTDAELAFAYAIAACLTLWMGFVIADWPVAALFSFFISGVFSLGFIIMKTITAIALKLNGDNAND